MCVEKILGSSESSHFYSFWLWFVDLSFIFGRVFLPVREEQLGWVSQQFVEGALIQNLLLPLGRVDLGHVLLKLFLCWVFSADDWLGAAAPPWLLLPWPVEHPGLHCGQWGPGGFCLLVSSFSSKFPNSRNKWQRGQEAGTGTVAVWCLWLHFSVKCSVPALFPGGGKKRVNPAKFVLWNLEKILPASGWAHSLLIQTRGQDFCDFLANSFQELTVTFRGSPVSPVSDCENLEVFWENSVRTQLITLWTLGKHLFPELWIFILAHQPLLFLSFSLLSLYFHWVSLPPPNPTLYLNNTPRSSFMSWRILSNKHREITP